MSNNGKNNDGKQPSALSNFCKFIYNPENKTVMDRTAGSWAQITVFYVIFYSCLAGFFAVQLAVFFVTVSSDEPSLTDKESILKGHPGMGFRPQPNHETTLVRFDQGLPESYQKYTTQISSFLDMYENQNLEGDDRGLACGDRGGLCPFPVINLGTACTKQKDFGYDEGQPCVLLKLNKIYGWEPDFYSSVDEIEDEKARELIGDRNATDHVWVTCEGENPADQENMGDIAYFPSNGFDKKFYPYLHQQGYRQPLVMVQFKKPKNGVVIQVWCKAWAKNIYHHRNDRAGSVRFELLID